MAEKKPKQKPSKSQISTGEKESKAVVHKTDHFRRNFYLLILALSFLFYGNTLFNGYSMDDDLVIKEHRLVKQGISAIPKIFVSRYSVNEKQSYEYRPVTLAVFAIEYQFFGEKPAVGHFINILLYALIGIVLFEVISAIFIQHHRILPALVVFLFMIHPIHSEVVASIKNRDELLAMLFSLLSMMSLLRYFLKKNHWKYLLYTFLFVVLAYLSKRSAMTLLAQLPLVVYFAHKSGKEGLMSTWKKLALSVGVVLIGFVVIKLFTMNVFGSGGSVRNPLFFENPLYADRMSLFERIPIALGCFWFYVQKLILPYPLVSYYGYNAYELSNWSSLTTYLGLFAGVLVTAYAFVKRKTAAPWIFGWIYLLITISMFTNIAVPAPGIVAERFAFGASIGFSVILAWVLLNVFKPGEQSTAIPVNLRNAGIVLLLVCAVFVMDRNRAWKSAFTLYLTDVQAVPKSAKLNSLMGTEYSNEVLGSLRGYGKKLSPQSFRQKTDSALFYFNQALTAYPDYAAVHNNIGTIYMMANEDYDKARYHFRRAVQVDTVYVQAFFNLGFQYQFDHEVFESLLLSFNNLEIDSLHPVTAQTTTPSDLWKLGVALQKTQRNAVSLMRQILQSKTKEDVAAKLNSFPQNLMQSVQINFSPTGFVPQTDSFANLATSRLRALFNNETSGDPEQMMKTAVIRFIGTQVAAHIQKSKHPQAYLSWAVYVADREQITRDSMFFCYNKTLALKPSMNQAYQQLNGLYRAYNMSDSVISLNTRLLHEDTYQPEQLHVYIANAYIYSNRIPQGIEHMKKAVEMNDVYLTRLALIANTMARAGNANAAQTMTLWYNQKRKENMGICDLISSKYLETGDVASGEQYKKLAIQYKQ